MLYAAQGRLIHNFETRDDIVLLFLPLPYILLENPLELSNLLHKLLIYFALHVESRPL